MTKHSGGGAPVGTHASRAKGNNRGVLVGHASQPTSRGGMARPYLVKCQFPGPG